MSPPTKFDVEDHQHAKRETMINGTRPSPLNINKYSHIIHKSSSSSSSSSSFLPSHHHQQQQQRHPVIIYTQSPKIIHTQARDFMALVQILTGLSNSNDEIAPPPPKQQQKEEKEDASGEKTMKAKIASHDDNNETSSALTEENSGGGGGNGLQVSLCSDLSPMKMYNWLPNNPNVADVPLFTPNSNEFFCSPHQPYFRYPDMVFESPNMVNSTSPSVLEFIKGLPGYGQQC